MKKISKVHKTTVLSFVKVKMVITHLTLTNYPTYANLTTVKCTICGAKKFIFLFILNYVKPNQFNTEHWNKDKKCLFTQKKMVNIKTICRVTIN